MKNKNLLILATLGIYGLYFLLRKVSTFRISIDNNSHAKWGFKYPITYVFYIPEGSSNIKVHKNGRRLNEKTSEDFFNGIEAVRFDYENNKSYVSVGFENSNVIYLTFNCKGIILDHIAQYYDHRKCVYSLSIDDCWCLRSTDQCGQAWQGITSDESDKCQAAVEVARTFNIPLMVLINSGKVNGTMRGGQKTWMNIQEEIDKSGGNWGLEPCVHTRTHPNNAEEFEVNGYEWEILGCRDDILSNLKNFSYGQYIFSYESGSSYYNDQIYNIIKNIFLECRGFGSYYEYNPQNDGWKFWDSNLNLYPPKPMGVTWAYDGLLSFEEDPPGRYNEDHVNAFNNAFDIVYNKGGIFYGVWHPGWYLNSVINSFDPPESGNASTLIQHLNYVANRKDVWYVTNGWLYLYHRGTEIVKIEKLK